MYTYNISLHDFRRPVSFMIIIIHEIGTFSPMIFMSARVVNRYFLVRKQPNGSLQISNPSTSLEVGDPSSPYEMKSFTNSWRNPYTVYIYIFSYVFIIDIQPFCRNGNFWRGFFGPIHRQEAELAVRKQLGERRGGGKLRSVYVARARRLQSFLGSWE